MAVRVALADVLSTGLQDLSFTIAVSTALSSSTVCGNIFTKNSDRLQLYHKKNSKTVKG